MTETGLSEEKSLRTCGNCGVRVTPTAVTCPSCDALLAAYEAPAGSATASDQATGTTFDHAPVSEPVVPAAPVITPPQRSNPAPFDAEAAIAEARRTLGMSVTPEPVPEPGVATGVETANEVEPIPVVTPVQEPSTVPTQRQETPAARVQTKVPTAPPEQTESRPQQRIAAPPAKEPSPAPEISRPRQAPVQASLPRVEPTKEIPAPPAGKETHRVNTGAQIAKYGFFLILFVIILRSSPLGISPLFFMVIAFVILGNVMKGSAKAGGRKTTSMKRLNDHDPWNTPR